MRFKPGDRVLYKGCELCMGRVVLVREADSNRIDYLVAYDPDSSIGPEERWCEGQDLEPASLPTNDKI